MTLLTVKDLSKEWDVQEATIRLWLRELKIPTEKSGNKIKIPLSSVEVLNTVRNLRTEDAGFTTIRRKISPVITKQLQNNNDVINDNDTVITNNENINDSKDFNIDDVITEKLQNNHTVITQHVTEAVNTAIERSEGIADKLSRATFEIGKLETENKFLKKELDEKDEQLKLLPSPDLWQSEQEHIKELKAQLKEKEEQIITQNSQLAQVKANWLGRILFKKIF